MDNNNDDAEASTSASSSSSLSSSSSSKNDLASLFECPVCFDYVFPPILQCQSGHLVCSTCRPKLSSCPSCRGPLGNIRNLAMEKVASTILFPCKYSSSGCKLRFKHTERGDHELKCPKRYLLCPCPGGSCKWQGSLSQVINHLLVNHRSITTLQGEDIVFLATDIDLPGSVDWVMLQTCHDRYFMLILEKHLKYDGHHKFYAVVQLIGTHEETEQFSYRFELNGRKRRLVWESTPISLFDGVNSAIVNCDCFDFEGEVARFFANNGNLAINVTISKVGPTTRSPL